MLQPLSAACLQAYYDEVTVCGNCMEICRKLDSIRASGFPDADGATATGGVAGAGATSSGDANVSGPPPPRPSSEPLPESVPALAGLSGEERRPGTAASGRGTGAAGSILPGEPREEVGDAAVGSARETERRSSSGLEGGEAGGAGSRGGSVEPVPKGLPKHTSNGSGSSEEGSALESGAEVSDVPIGAGPESDDIDGLVAEEVAVPSVLAAKTARNRDQKASSTRRDKVCFLVVRNGDGDAQDYQGAKRSIQKQSRGFGYIYDGSGGIFTVSKECAP